MQRRKLHSNLMGIVGAGLVALSPLVTSCFDSLICGPGTIEEGGECVTADSSKDPAACGRGTYFDSESQTCVSDSEPVICDDETTTPVNQDGVIVCTGSASRDCSSPPVCPEATPGNVTVCGQLVDVETGDPIQLDGTSAGECDPDNPAASGPCAMELNFYDALAFANNPQGAVPLAYESFSLDECGRFVAENVDGNVTLGFMGAGVDDHPDSGNSDYVLAGVAFGTASGQKIADVKLYAVRTSTDQGWTTSAGDPFGGMTFSEYGAYLAIFQHGEDRVTGVQITTDDSPRPNDSYYFSDIDPTTISTVDEALTETGVNGAGLLVNNEVLSDFSGTGGEVMNCAWPTDLAAAIPGLIFAQTRVMVVAPDGPEVCP